MCYQIRQAQRSDIPQLCALINSQYKRQKKERYFLWQYFESVYDSKLICAFQNNELAGMVGVLRKKLNDKTNICQLTDILIAKKYRQRGLFTLLYNKILNENTKVGVFCVLANLEGAKACKNLGFRIVCEVPLLINTKKAISLHEVNPVQFLSRVSWFEKNKKILKWRYGDQAEYQYFYVYISSKEFAVCKVYIDPQTKEKYGDIVDIVCNLNKQDRLQNLLGKVSEYLFSKKVKAISIWSLPHLLLNNVAVAMGFLKHTDKKFSKYFCVSVLDLKYEYLYNQSHWHLTEGDSDVF